MKYASVLYRDYADNSLFTPGVGENNGEFRPQFKKLRGRFLAAGIELNTPEVNAVQSGRSADGPQNDVLLV